MSEDQEKGYGYASGWSESGFDASIPIWDGRADSLREFKRTVTWWLSSIDLGKTRHFNLAARFAMKQRGAARLRALEFSPEDLAYTPEESVEDPDNPDGDRLIIQEANYSVGVWKLIESWEQMVGKTLNDKKGELRERFYMSLKRAPTEAVMNFSLRFRTQVAEMKAEGISIDDAEAAWFYKQKLALNEVQEQMLETTLNNTAETYADCEREAVRLFKRIHFVGNAPSSFGPSSLTSWRKPQLRPGGSGKGTGWRRPSSSASTSVASGSSNFSKGSSRMGLGASAVNITEQQEQLDDEQEGDSAYFEAYEASGEDHEGLQEGSEFDPLTSLQEEIEVLASELEAAAQEGCDSSELDSIEEQLDGAVEALVTLKEARTQIAAMRKDRGFKGPSVGGPVKKPGSKAGVCHVCHQEGHWKGDPECLGPQSNSKGKGKKGRLQSALKFGSGKKSSETHTVEVNVIDLLPTVPEVTFDSTPQIHEVHVIDSLPGLPEVLLSLSTNKQTLTNDKLLQAALDSACNRSCAGSLWIANVEQALQQAPDHVRSLIQRKPEQERFRFGNGGVLSSVERVKIPMLIGSHIVCLWISSVPCNSLGLLMGKDALDALGAVLDFLKNKVKFQLLDERWHNLHKLNAGHFAIPCLPTPLHKWPPLGVDPWIPVGRAKCCEVQGTKKNWLLKRLQTVCDESPSSACAVEHVVSAVFLEQDDLGEPPDHASQACCDTSNGLQAAGRACSGSMASDVHSSSEPQPLALARNPFVVDSAPLHPLSSSTSSISVDDQGMGRASRGHGEARILAQAVANMSQPGPFSVLAVSSEGVHASSRSNGYGVSLHGGRGNPFWHSSSQEEASQEDAASFGHRDPTSPSAERDRQARTTSRLARAQGRIAKAQGRACEGCSVAQHQVRARRHSGEDSTEVAASCQDHDGQSRMECTTSDLQFIDDSSGAEGQTHGRSLSQESNETSSGGPGIGRRRLASPWFARSSSSELDDGRTSHASTGMGRGTAPRVHVSDVGDKLLSSANGGGRSSGDAEATGFRSSVKPSIGKITKSSFAKLKAGIRQAVHQGFLKLRRLHEILNVNYQDIQETMEASEYDLKMAIVEGEKDCFVSQLLMPALPAFGTEAEVLQTALQFARAGPFLGETFTDTEQVKQQAERRGHTTMDSMTLPAFDFFKDSAQKRAFEAVELADPFAEIIAFPCGPWSPLQALRAKDKHRAMLLRWRRKRHKKLVDFAVNLAKRQLARGKHFIIENPSRSSAWFEVPSLRSFLQQPGLFQVEIDQCCFGLHGPGGGLRRKRTWILTSSEEVARELQGMKCDGSHVHEHVIGGNVSKFAGHYPPDLAKAFVRGLEKQFEREGGAEFDVMMGENELAEGDEPDRQLQPFEDDFDMQDDVDVSQALEPTRAQKQAVLRLHQNTGHRAPLRLAKALAIAGASPEIIKAAKELRCEVCHETQRPSIPRPASLPKPRQFGDQLHIDLVAVKDIHQQITWIMHAIDAASGYQVAQTMEAKSSDEVVNFFNVHWIAVLGTPKIVVADCGPEFTS